MEEETSQSDQKALATKTELTEKEIEEFLTASMNGDVEHVEKLLSAQPLLLEACDQDGYRALHRAAYEEHPKAVKFLLDHGASVNATTRDGWTPLHSAARWNAHKSLKILLAVPGAPVNARTEGGHTPLHCAALGSKTRECLTLLLLHPDIRVDFDSKPGVETAYELAGRNGPNAYLFELARDSINKF